MRRRLLFWRRTALAILAASAFASSAQERPPSPPAPTPPATPRAVTDRVVEPEQDRFASRFLARSEGRGDGGQDTDRADAKTDGPGFVVVVHASNPVTTLSRSRAARMFTRQIKSWEDFDPAVMPVDRNDDSPVRVLFTRAVHQKRVSSITEYWFRMIFSGRGTPPLKLDSDLAVIRFVATNPGAIGYIRDDTKLDPGVKVVPITD